MISCRLLPHESGDGPTNMAFDEVLLAAAASTPDVAVVRTYEWSVPTLSLGYFQPIAAVEADPRWQGRALVRRPTGGGALWHDQELTYAVAIPATHPLARPNTALYEAIHTAIATQLCAHEVAAARRGDRAGPAARESERPFLCFLDQDANDIVVNQVKLVGSAQRRRAGAVLQHGSLLLARSPVTPELPGLREVGGPTRLASLESDDRKRWITILRKILPEVVSAMVFAEHLTISERNQVDELRSSVYANPSWTYRR